MLDIRVEFELLREIVRHENDLIDQRLTWLIKFQSFLFLSFIFLFSKVGVNDILFILMLLGLMFSISIGIGTFRANESIGRLCERWDMVRPRDWDGIDIEGIRGGSGWFWWLMPGYCIPVLVGISWILIGLACLG